MLTAASEATSLLDQEEPSVATAELESGGMHCSACATRIQRALGRLPAVASASVNFGHHPGLCRLRPRPARPRSPVPRRQQHGLHRHPRRSRIVPVIRIGIRTIGISGSSSRGRCRCWLFWLRLAGPESATAGWTVLVLAIAVEIVGGWPFLRDAARLLRHGATSMDTLIALGTLAALGVSAVEAIALGGRHVHLGGGGAFAARLHGVMAPLIVSILATGRAIEMRARRGQQRRCTPCSLSDHPSAGGREH